MQDRLRALLDHVQRLQDILTTSYQRHLQRLHNNMQQLIYINQL
jgi:hypothetical protein